MRRQKARAKVLTLGPRSVRTDSREPALSEADGRLSLRGHCFSHHLRELPDVFLRRVERAHPADDRLLFDPHVEEVTLFYPGDGAGRDLREDAVGFNLPDDLYPRNAADFFFQQASYAIGVLGAAMPEIVGQQSLELRGDEAHF